LSRCPELKLVLAVERGGIPAMPRDGRSTAIRLSQAIKVAGFANNFSE